MKQKAKANLRAFERLLEANLVDPAMSRLYYSLFQAGVHALEARGKVPKDLGPYSEWKHSTVRESAYLVRNQPDDKVLFRDACTLREQADYGRAPVSRRQVADLSPKVRAFVEGACT